jgi:hypothetical protein
VKDLALLTKSNLILAASAFFMLALSSLAHAQAPDVTCKATETQAECHKRLKCKPYEELEDCQKRLKTAKPADGNPQNNDANNQNRDNNNNNNRGDRNDGNRNDGNNDRGNRNDGDNDRGDRGNRNDGDNDRGDRDDGGSRRRRSDRGSDRGGGHRQRASRGGSHGFEANKTFGLGLELGEPTGLTGKYFLSPSGALDFGVGWLYQHYYYGDGVNLYADYLWHPTSLVSAQAFELPFYIGVGARFWSFDYCDPNPNPDICYRGSSLGVRIPLGIAFDFNNVPLDIFFQLVPVIDFVNGDYYDRYRDRTHIGIDFSAGIRFWFK